MKRALRDAHADAFAPPFDKLRAGRTGGWVHTRDLGEGQTLRGLNGDLTVVELARDWKPQRVYNFEVETDHVYYVGGFEVLTHNSCRNSSPASFWTSTKNKTSVENAYDHWKKHGSEFPELNNALEYVKAAQNLFSDGAKGILEKIRGNGDKLRYDPTTNTFGAANKNGSIKTMFRPIGGQSYFDAQ